MQTLVYMYMAHIMQFWDMFVLFILYISPCVGFYWLLFSILAKKLLLLSPTIVFY